MMLLAPLALIGLIALPLIWWLIRATPPAPQDTRFPALLLLKRLQHRQEDTVRAPLWLLLLRTAAALLVIIGLAQPVLVRHHKTISGLNGTGPLLLVMDDGWAAIPRWHDRIATAQTLAMNAARQGRDVILMHSARGPDGALPEPVISHNANTLRDTLAQWRPEPWGTDRAALSDALAALHPRFPGTQTLLLSDGLATPADTTLHQSLSGPIADMRWPTCDLMALGAHPAENGTLRATVTSLPCPARQITLRARTETGSTLAVFPMTIPANTTNTVLDVPLPAPLRNRTDALTLDGQTGPAAMRLLDSGDRRHPVGLIESNGADTPLVGALYFLNRALAPIADLHRGDTQHLLTAPLSVLIATDGTLSSEQTRQAVANWIRKGGELIRFAGPSLAQPTEQGTGQGAEQPADPLLPVPLVGGMRQLGGPMSWGTPQHIAPFPDSSPFAGLDIAHEVAISRQVLAQPSADLDSHVWARLTDGTPLVTATPLGSGEVVLFHTTPTADWSNLPLSELFPDMLQRLVDRSAGLHGSRANGLLAPAETLDADGLLTPPPPSARGIQANEFPYTPVTNTHPAGLYGPKTERRALNLGDTLDTLTPEPLLGTLLAPTGAQPDHPIGPLLAFLGLLMLLADMLISFRLRGLLGRIALLALLATPLAGQAQSTPRAAPQAALETRLGYVLTGNADTDTVSRQGLHGLTDYVNARTSAQLGQADGVTPERDDLSYYPMLYWPITPDATTNPRRIAALNAFMAHGGIILIDTQGAGSDLDDEGQSRATRQALKRVTDGLDIPPLAKLTPKHVLAHTFFLLRDFPGRLAGQPVWVAQSGDQSNDDVSPVIIGAADWAHAWAVDESGNTPYATIPGGDDQRTLAYRFGTNVVLYALTGNYKGDQVHIPAILKRLGQ